MPKMPAESFEAPEEVNPYAAPLTVSPPEADVTPEGLSRPRYLLYSVGSIVLATFFGTIAAGAIILAINYRRLGMRAEARRSLIIGFAVTATTMLIAAALPDGVPSAVIAIPLLVGMALVANSLQGNLIATHKRHFGMMASPWKAFGIGVLMFFVWLLIIVLIGLTETTFDPV